MRSGPGLRVSLSQWKRESQPGKQKCRGDADVKSAALHPIERVKPVLDKIERNHARENCAHQNIALMQERLVAKSPRDGDQWESQSRPSGRDPAWHEPGI